MQNTMYTFINLKVKDLQTIVDYTTAIMEVNEFY